MKPYVMYCDDGSMLIEWVSRGVRFGLSFEPDASESSWYYVTSDVSECGEMPAELIEMFKAVARVSK